MIANTKIGNGDRAYKYFCQINPATKNEDIDGYQVEPYCFAQNILGDEHPQFGLGRNSWLSGTSSWTYQAATQYILGVRPTHHGLEVNPCLPSTWDKCQVTRHFRGATYHISIHNCKKDDSSKQTILVDGTKLEGSILPFAKAGTEVTVEVYLGQAVAEALPA